MRTITVFKSFSEAVTQKFNVNRVTEFFNMNEFTECEKMICGRYIPA